MSGVINNFLNNDSFFKISQTIGSSKINWFFENIFIYSEGVFEQTKQISHVLLNDLIKNSSEDKIETSPVAIPLLEDILIELKATKIVKAQLKLISKTENIFEFPLIKNNQDNLTAIMYLNKNDGYSYIEGIGKIKSEENRIVIFPSNTPHFESSSTNVSYRALLILEYSVD